LFLGGKGGVEGGDFSVESEEAVAEGGVGSGAEGEEQTQETLGVEAGGDVEVAQRGLPLMLSDEISTFYQVIFLISVENIVLGIT